MTVADAEFQETTASHRTGSVPLSQLSIELGHFYCDDLCNGFDFFQDHFRRIARWASAASDIWAEELPRKRPRISTCVLIDDYFGKIRPPRDILPKLTSAARAGGVEIDYVVRESGCADPGVTAGGGEGGGRSLAHLVEARLVEDPPEGGTGARPPVAQTGWLCNGQRSPATTGHEAMKEPARWAAPAENVKNNHSIFTDVELWSGNGGGRLWSCAMLAAVWQLLRLGMLRDAGRPVAVPQPLPDDLPDDWRRLPPVVRLNKNAAPFNAYRTLSICAPLFLPIEHAVRMILERVAVDPTVLAQIDERSGDEGVTLPPAVVNRIEYLFVDTGPVRGAGPR